MRGTHPTGKTALMLVLVGMCSIGLMFGANCFKPSEPKCTTDADCDVGEFCNTETGKCEAMPACTTDDDCPEGYVCDVETGECVPAPAACTTDEECDDGLFCNGVETCDVEAGACLPGTNPCAEGQTCDEETDTCVSEPIECTTDDDCPDGQFCNTETGLCEPAQPYDNVEFDHNFHMGLGNCASCHHAEPQSAGMACNACHLDEWVGGTPKLKEAMHDPDAGCRQCHDDRTEDGLWDCSFCHTDLNRL